MKKYALIASVLTISLASKCMEKENTTATVIRYDDSCISITHHKAEHVIGLMPAFQDTQLTTKAQERASLVPQVPFSINEKTMEELHTINRKVTKLDEKLKAAKTNSNNDQFIENEIKAKLKQQSNSFKDKLNLLDKEVLHNATSLLENKTSEIKSQESALLSKLQNNQITKDEYNLQLAQIKDSFRKYQMTEILDEFILAHRKVQAVQQIAVHELTKNQSNKLFIMIEEKYRIQAGHLAAMINSLVKPVEELPQPF